MDVGLLLSDGLKLGLVDGDVLIDGKSEGWWLG